ncbi:MAG: hypothetical protein ACLRX6_03550 [Limosilactobacillus pontis]|uniref:hypothetical protein n=1 Tax=Limosilactobacillus pontis TaxID=35787 RepID=UPI0039A322F7
MVSKTPRMFFSCDELDKLNRCVYFEGVKTAQQNSTRNGINQSKKIIHDGMDDLTDKQKFNVLHTELEFYKKLASEQDKLLKQLIADLSNRSND